MFQGQHGPTGKGMYSTQNNSCKQRQLGFESMGLNVRPSADHHHIFTQDAHLWTIMASFRSISMHASCFTLPKCVHQGF